VNWDILCLFVVSLQFGKTNPDLKKKSFKVAVCLQGENQRNKFDLYD